MSQYIIFCLTYTSYYVTIYITLKVFLKCIHETFTTVVKKEIKISYSYKPIPEQG